MTLRCVLDGLLLPARIIAGIGSLIAYDGDEPFTLEAIEAIYYEVVCATPEEMLAAEQGKYRLLRRAADFHTCEQCG